MTRTARRHSALFEIRLLYVLVFASFGPVGSYESLYFRRVGLSNAEIGILMGLIPVVMLLSGPAWSAVADRFGMRSRMLTVVLALGVVPTLAMGLTTSFQGLLGLVVLKALFQGPVTPLLDSATLEVLGDQRHRYATVRAFGSMGYAPVAWGTGLMIERLDIRLIFVLNALLAGLAAVVSTRIRGDRKVLPRSIGRGLGDLVRQPGWLSVMAAYFVAMTMQGVAFTYTNLYMDALGASESLMGLTQALGSLGQTLLMFGLLPRLLRRWGSERLLVMALACFGVRVGVWAIVSSPLVVGLTNLLTGLTMGAAAVAAVDVAARHAPPGLEATSQAIASGLISGLGRSVGSSSAGALYDAVGPRPTFGAYGVGSLLAAVAFRAFWRRLLHPRARVPHEAREAKSTRIAPIEQYHK